MGLSEIWSIIAVVLHLCGVGSFAEWPIIAWPWHWSCLCIELWVFGIYGLVIVAVLLWMLIKYMMSR